MDLQQLFPVDIAVSQGEVPQLVTQRIAQHERTCTIQESPQMYLAREKKQKYREDFLRRLRDACAGRDNAQDLIKNFVQMSDALNVLQAIALHVSADETGIRTILENRPGVSTIRSPSCGDSPRRPPLHRLIIAMLAFHMGGAVNAANNVQYRAWKSLGTSGGGMPDFLVEGDSSDVFDEYRLMLAWELHDKRLTKPSGWFTLMRKGVAQGQSLQNFAPAYQEGPAGPVAVIYNPREAALRYDCQSTRAIRYSVSLDLHVNTVTNEDVDLLSSADFLASKPAALTLWDLVTHFPIPNYDEAFHRLLFADGAFDQALDILALFNVPVEPTQLSGAPHDVLERQYQEWHLNNLASIPLVLRGVPGIRISGTHASFGDFVTAVYHKAFQDIHLTLGKDMVPQSPIDAEREYARKFIRDRPDETVSQSIVEYQQYLVTPYTSADLITTGKLCEYGRCLGEMSFRLSGMGFVDDEGLLPAIGSLAACLGDAVDGWKECWVAEDVLVKAEDLVIFRVKSLYLFWCADWLARYLSRPQQGPYMVSGPRDQEFEHDKGRPVQIATLLLRNWVAWSLVAEALPKGPLSFAAPKAHKF
jgi:hypothetical protein